MWQAGPPNTLTLPFFQRHEKFLSEFSLANESLLLLCLYGSRGGQ